MRDRIFRSGMFTLFVLGFLLFYVRLAVHDETPLLDGDDAVYAIMADYFSPFSDRPPDITQLVMRHSQFPPLYPLMLGITGAHSAHLWWAHYLTVGFLVGSLVLLYFWARFVLSSTALAALVATIFGLMPVTIIQAFGIASENPYLLFCLTTFLCLTKSDDDKRYLYAAALAVAAACMTRTIGIVLLLSYAYYIRRLPRMSWLTLMSIAIFPLVAWTSWKIRIGSQGSYLASLQELLQNRSLFDFVRSHFSSLPHDLLNGWITSFNHLPSTATLIVGSALAVLCFAGTLYRSYRGYPDGIYVLLYILVIIFWPWSYEARRFLYVVIPIVLVHGVLLLQMLTQRSHVTIGVAYPYIYFAAIGLFMAPAVALIAQRFMAAAQQEELRPYAVSPTWYGYADVTRAKARITEQKALIFAWKQTAARVLEGECVYHIKPAAFMLYSNRTSYASPLENDEERFWKRASRCRYFYLGAYTYLPYNEALYPQRYLHDARLVSGDYLRDTQGDRLLGRLVELPAQRRLNNN